MLFTIDGAKNSICSVNTRAWATKPEDDRGLVKAMKRGRTLKVRYFHPGNTTIDTYSLKGFTKALAMIERPVADMATPVLRM